MRRITIILMLASLLYSCNPLRIPRSDTLNASCPLSITIANHGTYKEGTKSPETFLSLFDTYGENVDSVRLDFTKDSLLISYQPKFYKEKIVMSFECRLDNKGYYEIFIRDKKINIPPIISLYVNIDIDRKRMTFTRFGKFVVDNKVRKGKGFLLYNVKGKRTQFLYDVLSRR